MALIVLTFPNKRKKTANAYEQVATTARITSIKKHFYILPTNYNARAQPLFCSLKLLFSDVPVAVGVVVFSNSKIFYVKRGLVF